MLCLDRVHCNSAMRIPTADVVDRIATLASRKAPLLVALDGGAGAGKTTFAEALADSLRASGLPVAMVKTDLFFRPVSKRWAGPIEDMPIGYDLDWERLRDEVITPLREGREARTQLYDWAADGPGRWQTLEPIGVVIVDGVFALREELASLYDFRVWLECKQHTRLQRLVGRGDTPASEVESWFPVEERYFQAHRPWRHANLVIHASSLPIGFALSDSIEAVWR
jgi:uridine kinase